MHAESGGDIIVYSSISAKFLAKRTDHMITKAEKREEKWGRSDKKERCSDLYGYRSISPLYNLGTAFRHIVDIGNIRLYLKHIVDIHNIKQSICRESICKSY